MLNLVYCWVVCIVESCLLLLLRFRLYQLFDGRLSNEFVYVCTISYSLSMKFPFSRKIIDWEFFKLIIHYIK